MTPSVALLLAVLETGGTDTAPTFASVLGEEAVRGAVERVEGEVREDLRKRSFSLEIGSGFTEAVVGRILPLKVRSTDEKTVAERLKTGFKLFLQTVVKEALPTVRKGVVILTKEAATAIRGAQYCGMIPCDQPPCCKDCDPPPCVTPTAAQGRTPSPVPKAGSARD